MSGTNASWRLVLCLALALSTVAIGRAQAQNQEEAPKPPAPDPQAEPKPAPPSAAPAEPARLYMPDGQLSSHSIRIYIDKADVPATANPVLRLYGSNAVTTPSPTDNRGWKPALVATGQTWTEPSLRGRPEVQGRGTLLLFDLKPLEFDYKAMRRMKPIIEWQDGAATRFVVGEREVNIGNTLNAVGWTLVVVGVALVVIVGLAKWGKRKVLELLTGVDGHLSLAQTQIAWWTIAIGSVVLGYGFVRFDIPEIPETLLALMGASLVTGGVGFVGDVRKQHQAAAASGVAPAKRTWELSDLIKTFPADGGNGELSLAKAQMLFWTVLLSVLFVSKSILGGEIWEVPWQLVALMGFSQASFLAPKIAGQQPATQPPPAQNAAAQAPQP